MDFWFEAWFHNRFYFSFEPNFVASRIRVAAEAAPLVGGRYPIVLVGVWIAGILLTLADLITSYVALGEGFVEGNLLLTGLSRTLSLNTVESLLVTKAIFIMGMTILAVVGLRSEQRGTKKVVLATATVFMALFAFVSLNNLFWITS